eukprot:7815658-Pyramimonas_sp.AAC.2
MLSKTERRQSQTEPLPGSGTLVYTVGQDICIVGECGVNVRRERAHWPTGRRLNGLKPDLAQMEGHPVQVETTQGLKV